MPVDIEDEMKRSYLDYAMSVIIGRALPDVRDGLKPVHRRVLYGMWEAGNTANKPYKKSARIVGDVMGKYHPHGDTAIYDTVVRMAQDFSMRYTLVDGQGNFGSIDGDNPAAMRYTEVRLDQARRGDAEATTSTRRPSSGSRTTTAPRSSRSVLPAKVPNLLINGGSRHRGRHGDQHPAAQPGRGVDALMLLIDDPETPIEKLMRAIPGPDFPTAGFIHGLAGIRQAYATGRGIIQMRARAGDRDPSAAARSRRSSSPRSRTRSTRRG